MTSFASRLCAHTPTVACWCRCPCVSFVTARIPRASPAIAGQRGERVEDPSSLSPAYPCFARPRHSTPIIPFPTDQLETPPQKRGPHAPIRRGPSATTPNLGLSSHWQTEATSEVTPPSDLFDHPGPDPHCTQLLFNTCTAPPDTLVAWGPPSSQRLVNLAHETFPQRMHLSNPLLHRWSHLHSFVCGCLRTCVQRPAHNCCRCPAQT